MNNIWHKMPVKSRAKNFWEIMPYTKEFRYQVQMTMDECLTRLYCLQPSRTVSVTQDANQAQFKICVKRYDNRFRLEYNTAVAYGIVMTSPEHPEMMIITGFMHYKIVFWLYLFVLAMHTLVSALTGYIIFGLLGLVLCLVFIRRDYNDYQQLHISLRDTLTQEQNAP